MKNLLIFSVMVALGFCFSLSAHAQNKAESSRLSKEGMEATRNKDWDGAIEAFRKAAAIDPKSEANLAAALQQRGSNYTKERRFPDAVADYTEALKLTPQDASIYGRRAYVLIKMGDLDKALADYSEAIKLEPNEVSYLSGRSYLFETKGDVKNAMADNEKILKLQRKNKEAIARKTRLETRLKQAPPVPLLSPGQPPAGTSPAPAPTKAP